MVDEVNTDTTVEAPQDNTQINNKEINNNVNDTSDNKYVDKEAYEEVKQQSLAVNKQLKEQEEKINRMKKALLDEDSTTGMTEAQKQEFFQSLADNPKETIKKLTQETANKDLEEIKQWKEQQDLEKANNAAISYLSQVDPDFNNVHNNMAKYLKPDEFEFYKNRPDGYEILYSKVKTRMDIENKQKQQQTQTATNTAKNIANQTANTEIPTSSGRTQEATVDDIDRNIATAREEGIWNKGEGFSELDKDIFAQYQRDVYGIKPKK